MTAASSLAAKMSPAPTTADPNALAVELIMLMDALAALVREETDLVRAGRLADAATLEPKKTDLARRYMAHMSDALGRSGRAPALPQLAAEQRDALRAHHESFRGLLEINMTVLATAHAVSEGIVRGVSGELARKSAPQTYGASGRTVAPPRNAAPALAISRTL